MPDWLFHALVALGLVFCGFILGLGLAIAVIAHCVEIVMKSFWNRF